MNLPEWVEPELATLTHERFSDPGWIFERKLDGERCLAFADESGVRLRTRNQKDVTTTFPEVAGALEGRRGLVVDGEIVAFDGDQTRFERLQGRLGVVRPSDELMRDVPVVYFVFDVLYADGQDVRALPLLERKGILGRALDVTGAVRVTEHRVGDGEAFYAEACRAGWEGLVAKRADAPYLAGRTRDWLKFKCLSGQELVVGGWTDPQRSRVGFGALLLGYVDADGDLVYAGKVGTGFDTATLRGLAARLGALERSTSPFGKGRPPTRGVHWAEPRLVAQIAFAEWTRDGQLRQPRFQGLRDDKDPKDVVREDPGASAAPSG
jgi:DNA ligase D-like protein (predicted ligase)